MGFIAEVSLKEREGLYNAINDSFIFKKFYEAYTKAVELAETEPSSELKNILFRERIGRFVGVQNGDVIDQLVGKYPFAHLFLNPADGGYILNSNRKPITLEEALGVDARKLEQERAAANEAVKQERIEAAEKEGGVSGNIKVWLYKHTDG